MRRLGARISLRRRHFKSIVSLSNVHVYSILPVGGVWDAVVSLMLKYIPTCLSIAVVSVTAVHMTADELLVKVFPDTDMNKQRYGIPVDR